MRLRNETALTFDDVLLVPRRSTIRSRHAVNTQTDFSRHIKLAIPIVSANMDTVTEAEMAITLARMGGLGIIHRFMTVERQASEIVADAAQRSAQYYVNSRWLGGMLTNWKTISNSIQRLRKLDEMLTGEQQGFTKKERLNLDREREKLDKALGGIKDMGSTPDLMFVIDTNKEAIAIQEAKRLSIPVVAVIDSNCDPDKIDFPIPGNDDAQRAIALYCDLIAKAAIDGISRSQGERGVDIGASSQPIGERHQDL